MITLSTKLLGTACVLTLKLYFTATLLAYTIVHTVAWYHALPDYFNTHTFSTAQMKATNKEIAATITTNPSHPIKDAKHNRSIETAMVATTPTMMRAMSCLSVIVYLDCRNR
jgi:hypothetical protein